MIAPKHLPRAAIAALAIVGMFYCEQADSDDARPIVHAQKQIGDTLVRVVEYEQQYGDVVPEFGERLWRTVLCVEVHDRGAAVPRRVWHAVSSTGRLNNRFEPRTLILSDAAKGRCVITFSFFNAVYTGLVDLEGKVEPPPAKVEIDPKSGSPIWKNPAMLVIPDPTPSPTVPGVYALRSIGKPEIGMELTHGEQVWLKSAAKTNTGWRIDATVYATFDQQTQEFGHKTILRFAILLDEECKSARFEVVK